MDKKIGDKIGRITRKHAEAVILDDLERRKERISEITIVAGDIYFKVPPRYFGLFVPALVQAKEFSAKALMDEMNAKEDYDG